MNTYLFILSPPYCGSTLLSKLIATSDQVSFLPKEGQFIAEVEDCMRKDPWSFEQAMPWHKIKAAWHQYWDEDKRYLLEKSPPNIIRAGAIQEHFQPAYFIINVRDPYAHCEGLMRRREGWDEKRAVDFCILCMKTQTENLRRLNNTISITYEQLCDNPEKVFKKIETFLPEIKDVKTDQTFSLHSIDGQTKRKITNLNRKKIRRLPAKSIRLLSQYFEPHLEVIEFWGYELYQPDFWHEPRRAVLSAMDLWAKRIYPKLRFILSLP